MAAVELATGYVSLAVETSNISKSIGSMFKGADKQAASTGKSMGKALKSNFEDANQIDLDSMRKEVEVAEGKITATIERNSTLQQKAKRAVEIAEAELEEKRNSGRVTASQLMKAEDKLTTARQKSEAASLQAKSELQKYTKELDSSKSALADAEAAAGRAAEGSVSAWSGVGQRIKAGLSGDFKTAFNGVEGDASRAADDVAQEFTSAGDDASEGFSDKLIGGLKGLGGLAAGAGIGVSLASGITGGMEREKLGDKLAAQLDLAGPEAKRAGDVAGSLYAGAWGESMDETHDAVASVMSSIPGMMNAPQEALEGVTAKALDLSSAFDVDVNESVGAIGVMMREGLAPDANAAFDLMVGGMQRVPAAFRDELLPAFTEYSGYFGDLGISGETAMNMMIRGAENGTIGVDKMGDAVKEFQIRSTDMSKATGDVYDTLGLDMQDMTNKILAGGDSAQDALGEIINGLTEIEDPAERAEAAIGLFGTPLEDLSVNEIPNFLGMLDPAGDALDDFAGSSEKLGDTLNNNTATAFESLKRGISQGFVDIVGTLAQKASELYESFKPLGDWLNEHRDTWGPFAIGIGLVAGAVIAWKVATAVLTSGLWGQAAALAAAYAPITAIVVGVGLLVGAVVWAYQNVGWFRDLVDTAWAWIKDATASLVTWWTGTAFPAVMDALAWVGDKFVWLYENVIKPVWGWIKGAISAVITWFTETAIPAVQGAVESVGAFFTWLNDTIIQPVWTWIRDAIAGVVEWFTGTVVPAFEEAVNRVGGFFDFLYRNFIAPFVWLFQTAIGLVSAWFRDTIVPAFESAVEAIGAVFRWLNDHVIQPVWTWIQDKIAAFWNWYVNVFGVAIRRAIRNVGEFFVGLYNSYVKPVWDWIKAKIDAVVKWFRDVLVPMFRTGIERVMGKFSDFKSRVETVWEGAKTLLRNGWNWIAEKVFDPFKRGLDNLKQGFIDTKNGIADAWNKLREAVRKPIDAVVTKVVNPFLVGYNKINDAWSGDNIGPLKGWSDGYRKGGYTGAGNPGAAAGIVHKDEHVIRSESRRDIEKRAPGLLDRLNRGGASALPSFGHEGHAAHGGAAAGGPGGPGTYLWGGLQNAIYASGVAHVRGSAPGYDIPAATRAWNNMSNLKVKYGSGPNQINVGGGAPAGTWGYAWTNGQIALNPGIPAGMKTGTAAHEIGHVLGLDHAGTNSIMHPMMRGPLWPSAFDRSTIQRIYGGSGKGNPPEGGGGGFSILGAIKGILSKPLGALKSLLDGGNTFTQMAGGIAKNVVNGIMEKATGGRIDGIWDAPVGATHALPPGVSSIYNGTGGVEHFQRVDPNGNGGGGGMHFHGDVYTASPEDLFRTYEKRAARRETLAYVA